MRSHLALTGLTLLALAAPCAAQDVTADFPYEATINGDQVIVRSGPGGSYYPTGKLKTGDRVTVHRHDPGGWFMIAPPPASFSWISADSIQVEGSKATVTAVSTPVRVGSRFDDHERDVVSTRLTRGDTVEVIGPPLETRGQQFYRIKAPRQAFRWVSGGAVAAITRASTAGPSQRSRDTIIQATGTANGVRPAQRDKPNKSTDVRFETSPIDRKPYDALKVLDRRFGRIVSRPPAQWTLTPLENEYRTLMSQHSIPGFKSLVRQRLAAVKRYRTRQQGLLDIASLAKSTTRRDQTIKSVGHSVPHRAPTTTPKPRAVPSFTGAGIVRPIAAGPRLPSHVLVTPDGRLLTFLKPAPGINISAWVNRSVGVTGPRRFAKNLQADLLVVQSLQPVRLK